MNKILLLLGVISLLTTAGCLVADDRRHEPDRGRVRYERQPEVRVQEPVVVVRPPEITVR